MVKGIVEMCDFIEHPAIKEAAAGIVPVSMPRLPDAVLNIPLWVGLGTVGLWAALDAFAERADLTSKCPICDRRSCIWTRFAPHPLEGYVSLSLEELEDIRHLYAHNYAGDADDEYFDPKRKRHVLRAGKTIQLTCGEQLDGRRLSLHLRHLRYYANTAQSVLGRFP
jgi:hypothetical protein